MVQGMELELMIKDKNNIYSDFLESSGEGI